MLINIYLCEAMMKQLIVLLMNALVKNEDTDSQSIYKYQLKKVLGKFLQKSKHFYYVHDVYITGASL